MSGEVALIISGTLPPIVAGAVSLSTRLARPSWELARRPAAPVTKRPRLGRTGRTTGAIALFVVSAVTVGLVLTTAAAGSVILRRRWQRLRGRRARAASIAGDAPDTVDMFVALVRAGLTPVLAVTELATRGPPSWRPGFTAVVDAHRRGLRFAEAIDELASALGPAAGPLADSIGSADRYGHALAPVLERLSAEAAALRRRQSDIQARQLPVRMCFPLVVCTLPSFLLLTIAPLLAGAFRSLGTGVRP
jgi:tight adherence protein C